MRKSKYKNKRVHTYQYLLSHCLCADPSFPRFGMLDNSVAERVESLAKMPHLTTPRRNTTDSSTDGIVTFDTSLQSEDC